MSEQSHAVVERRTQPVVIDADGLNCLAPWPATLIGSQEHPLILTPHLGEMLRLIGTDNRSALDERVAAAREFATTRKVILVLKGSRSLVAAPDGRVFINPTGNAGLGTAGSGDTLTGLITGFLSQAFAGVKQQASALEATIAALYIGGLAADFAARKLGMRTMAKTSNGFVIAEKDLELRGPGEILGTKQSGLPEFRIGNLVRDQAILEKARVAAEHYVTEKATSPQTQRMIKYLSDTNRYGLASIG